MRSSRSTAADARVGRRGRVRSRLHPTLPSQPSSSLDAPLARPVRSRVRTRADAQLSRPQFVRIFSTTSGRLASLAAGRHARRGSGARKLASSPARRPRPPGRPRSSSPSPHRPSRRLTVASSACSVAAAAVDDRHVLTTNSCSRCLTAPTAGPPRLAIPWPATGRARNDAPFGAENGGLPKGEGTGVEPWQASAHHARMQPSAIQRPPGESRIDRPDFTARHPCRLIPRPPVTRAATSPSHDGTPSTAARHRIGVRAQGARRSDARSQSWPATIQQESRRRPRAATIVCHEPHHRRARQVGVGAISSYARAGLRLTSEARRRSSRHTNRPRRPRYDPGHDDA